jgi:hypothetical protein
MLCTLAFILEVTRRLYDCKGTTSIMLKNILCCMHGRACNELVDEVGQKRPFLGGVAPNMADLAVYGVLKAVEKTPTFVDAMQHSRIQPWYNRMTEVIGPASRVSTEGSTWGLTTANAKQAV